MKTPRIGLISLIATTFLAACGGGSGYSAGSMTGGTDQSASLTTTGTITAFGSSSGSIIVGATQFDTNSATVTMDDQPATESDLEVGQSVTVSANAAVGLGMARALRIEAHHRVVGPVTTVDAASSTFVILGQTVKITDHTSFASNLAPADITGIHVGDFLAVFGMKTADGSIVATRIHPTIAARGDHVGGMIAALNTTAHTFKINALTVDYTAAVLSGFTAAGPANGDAVWVHGTSFDATTITLTATAMRKIPVFMGLVEREGMVTRFASIADFDIDGLAVTTTSTTFYRNGTAADVVLNATIEAHGTVDGTGKMTATVIEIDHRGIYALAAPATAINTTDGTMTVLGVTVAVNARTRFEDITAAHVRNLALSNLAVNDVVAIRGYESPAGSGKLVATRVERLPTSLMVGLVGPYTATTQPQFKVLSVVVDTAAATFNASRMTPLTATQFFAQAPGRNVVVLGTGSAPVVASRVILLPPGDDD